MPFSILPWPLIITRVKNILFNLLKRLVMTCYDILPFCVKTIEITKNKCRNFMEILFYFL